MRHESCQQCSRKGVIPPTWTPSGTDSSFPFGQFSQVEDSSCVRLKSGFLEPEDSRSSFQLSVPAGGQTAFPQDDSAPMWWLLCVLLRFISPRYTAPAVSSYASSVMCFSISFPVVVTSLLLISQSVASKPHVALQQPVPSPLLTQV